MSKIALAGVLAVAGALAAGCGLASSSGSSPPAATPAPAAPTTCAYQNIYDSYGDVSTTYVLAQEDPGGCPDQALVQNLAYNTGEPWSLATSNGNGPGDTICTLGGNFGSITVVVDGTVDTTANAACAGLENSGAVPQ